MLTRIDLRDTDPDARDLAAILPRADLDVAAAVRAPRPAQAPPGAVYRLVRSSSMTPAQLRP